MTKPKAGIRLGFGTQQITLDVDGRRERLIVVESNQDRREFAQLVFLQHVARHAPVVLRELIALNPAPSGAPKESELRAWAKRRHLSVDWVLAHARPTSRGFRQRPDKELRYWFPVEDESAGELYTPRPGRGVARLIKNPKHFEWLVRFQVLGESFTDIGASPRHKNPSAPVAAACRTLANLLGLKLRPSIREPRQRPKSHASAILRLLSKRGGMTRSQIAAALTISASTARDTLRSLLKDERVEKQRVFGDVLYEKKG